VRTTTRTRVSWRRSSTERCAAPVIETLASAGKRIVAVYGSHDAIKSALCARDLDPNSELLDLRQVLRLRKVELRQDAGALVRRWASMAANSSARNSWVRRSHGLVVALALIPEANSVSIIAGVDPAIGLFASFTMAVTIAIVGGRPAMISAATGVVALVIAPLNRERGFGYLVAAVILAAVFQIARGVPE
jgi:hypothetical protein